MSMLPMIEGFVLKHGWENNSNVCDSIVYCCWALLWSIGVDPMILIFEICVDDCSA